MIYVKNTPNNTGVAIHGDYMDMENLYKACVWQSKSAEFGSLKMHSILIILKT